MTTKNNLQSNNDNTQLDTIYFAGGCLWGVQEFIKHLPGVITTQAGRANGTTNNTQSDYDGYAECVKFTFDSHIVGLVALMDYFFEIIDPYSMNKQGNDVGRKYPFHNYIVNYYNRSNPKVNYCDKCSQYHYMEDGNCHCRGFIIITKKKKQKKMEKEEEKPIKS